MSYDRTSTIQLSHFQNLAALVSTLLQVINSRFDANVTASTDSDADYATELVDGRVDTWGNTLGSLGANIRAGQLRLDLALKSEETHRIEDNQSLQKQIDALSAAVLETLAIISENRERIGGNT